QVHAVFCQCRWLIKRVGGVELSIALFLLLMLGRARRDGGMELSRIFPRVQTAPGMAGPAVARNVTPKSIWILDSWPDLFLYVGTAVFLIPLFGLARLRWSVQDIYLFVAAFGAMGHHFPGMMRAYGDRALFERFRARFIFAPIFLLTVCIVFSWYGFQGIILM